MVVSSIHHKTDEIEIAYAKNLEEQFSETVEIHVRKYLKQNTNYRIIGILKLILVLGFFMYNIAS